MSHRSFRYGAAALTATVLISGCGAVSKAQQAAKDVKSIKSALAGLAAATSQGPAALGAVSAELDVSKQCAAVSHVDLQSLVKADPGTAANNPLECAWSGTDLKVNLSPNDADKSSYIDLVSTDGHPIAGDLTTTTLPYTGTDRFFTITDADSLAYATKEAKLCADISSVS